ncbi:phytanoyl-CoA dioxygenase family protein [Spirosoma sp. RP8]|uniref:Phytanoyl-CoA dioxygenase family protein n=1 Tax=Spirosoma liriopis TaxID=2937440 RepID=A0ABT0HEH5_9BACT|nr:phytanoyl-CoA dioxygenase family protein [Spirosoma liriopis]MCK8490551.1 phytanoyl-CoA dioxygenase family protein [Spirosoma liriopis]
MALGTSHSAFTSFPILSIFVGNSYSILFKPMANLSVAERMNLPWVESPFFDNLLTKKNISSEQQEQAIHYNREGFVLFHQLVDHTLIDCTLQEIEHEYPAHVGDSPSRQQDLWRKYSSVRELASQPPIFDALRFLYDREPIPFQTLNFKFGSQQRAHSDSIHFSSTPARFMCGVWIAMEDTNAENGPLFYYPRSHRQQMMNYFDIGLQADGNYLEYPKYEDFMEQFMVTQQFEKHEIHMQKGDVLIWSANLVHGGMPIKGGNATRWSQVTHYFFEDCMYFSPRLSDMFSHNLSLLQVTNIATGKVVQHSQNGIPIETINTGNFQYAVSHKFTLPVLMKEVIKKLLGKKPF